jgi:hypothetical protein
MLKLGNVTFVHFAPYRGPYPSPSHDAVPGKREQFALEPAAEPVGAFAAHSNGGRGLCHGPSAAEHLEKAKLTIGRPAVAADSSGFCLRAGIGCAHPPAWIINAAL